MAGAKIRLFLPSLLMRLYTNRYAQFAWHHSKDSALDNSDLESNYLETIAPIARTPPRLNGPMCNASFLFIDYSQDKILLSSHHTV